MLPFQGILTYVRHWEKELFATASRCVVNIVEKVSDHVALLVFAPGTLKANVWASVWTAQHAFTGRPLPCLSAALTALIFS
ncbi:hypothetical protein P7K49_019455 [Saguinus oedipus]|uniref:Uncharacterized protein n=1 Tax=Saguinus oedipus TaxID=9490 RepID=A0ABQ9UXD8_SAGOE|nr:hypothetical protein P7K49_019455 [Saguinus oedipus]